MSSIDKLRLLAGLPIQMSDLTCFVHQSTLGDIAQMGSSQYFKYINLITLKEDEVAKIYGAEIDPFEFMIISCQMNEEFKKEFVKALNFFTKEEILILIELEAVLVGPFEESRMLTRDNFLELQNIIRIQNFIPTDAVKYAGQDESAKIINESLERSRKKIERLKGKSENSEIELADLIGSLLSKSPSLNLDNIWKTSYYTFNDQFKRMRILENYETGLQSIMAGADPKKIKLEDWIQSIQ